MEGSTQAIVLHTTKYGETSVMLHCYTERFGLRSYVVKGARSKKKNKSLSMGMFQPLTQLELLSSTPKSTRLPILKAAKIIHPYTSIPTDILKSSICIFLAEVFRSVLKEEEENQPLYRFLEHALIWIDTRKQIANAHVFVLIQLTKYLGFYPDTTYVTEPYFDLENGQFSSQVCGKESESGQEIEMLKAYLGTKFDKIDKISANADQRRRLLQLLMRYYQLHVQSFRPPKSLDILYEVFND